MGPVVGGAARRRRRGVGVLAPDAAGWPGLAEFVPDGFRPWRAVGLTVAVGLVAFTALWRLDMATWLTDEVVYADAARAYLAGDLTVNPEHPPLAKLILAASRWLIHDGLLAVRLPAALAGVATGMVSFVFARRLAGFWAGVAAMAAWGALPHAAAGLAGAKLERFATLDVFAGLFATVALYAGWRWLETTPRNARTAWRWPAATGAAAGLAVAAKASGGLVAVPALIVAPLVARDRRFAAQAGLAGAVAAGVVVATYLPLGSRALEAVTFMVDFQTAQGAAGHAVEVAGQVYAHPPWWAYLWWEYDSYGLAVVALLVGVGAAVAVRGRAGGGPGYLLAAVAVPMLALSVFYGRALAHYAYVWQPALTVLAVVGIAVLVTASGWRRLAGVAAAITLAALGVATTSGIATMDRSGYATAAEVIGERAPSGAIATWGYKNILRTYVPAGRVKNPEFVADCRGRTAVVLVDPALADRMPQPAVAAALGSAEADFRKVEVDRLDLYLRDLPASPTC